MSVLDLVGQTEFVAKCMTGMGLLCRSEHKVEYLIQITRAGKSKLNDHGFRDVLENIASADFEGSVGDLAKMLRQSWGNPINLSGQDEAHLFAGMCWLLEDTIIEDKEPNPVSLGLWFTEVIYFGGALAYESSQNYGGKANRLLRVFAERCPEDLLDELTVELENDPSSNNQIILNSLADGNNKIEGSWTVRKAYRSTKVRRE